MLFYLSSKVPNLPPHQAAHLIVPIFGLIGLIYTSFIGRVLGASLMGFLACLFLALCPEFYGHSIFNIKDVPFLALNTASVFYLIRLLKLVAERSRFSFRIWELFPLGISIGLTNGIRIAGMLILATAVISILVVGLIKGERKIRRLLKPVFIVGVSSWAVMVAFWPYAQLNPILNPFITIIDAFDFKNVVPVFSDGRYFQSTNLPRTFEIELFFSSIPDFTVLLNFIVSLVGLYLVWKERNTLRHASIEKILGPIIVILMFCIPLFACLALRPNNFDRLRHQLFIYPTFSISLSFGVVSIIRYFRSRIIYVSALGTVALGACVIAYEMKTLHPYEYSYINNIIGNGMHNGLKNRDNDYWGLSMKEASDWLIENKGAFVSDSIIVTGPIFHAWGKDLIPVEYYLNLDPDGNSKFRYVQDARNADIEVKHHRFSRDEFLNHSIPIIHQVKREGVPFASILWRSKKKNPFSGEL